VGRGTWDVVRGTWDVGRGAWDVGQSDGLEQHCRCRWRAASRDRRAEELKVQLRSADPQSQSQSRWHMLPATLAASPPAAAPLLSRRPRPRLSLTSAAACSSPLPRLFPTARHRLPLCARPPLAHSRVCPIPNTGSVRINATPPSRTIAFVCVAPSAASVVNAVPASGTHWRGSRQQGPACQWMRGGLYARQSHASCIAAVGVTAV
jgi:hypothetical protein